jgi:hypothetical protein
MTKIRFFSVHLGGVHKGRPQLGGEGVEDYVTECDNRGGGV